MVGAGNLYGVIDVLDDFFITDTRQFAPLDGFARELVAFEELASFVIATAFGHFLLDGGVDFGIRLFRVGEIPGLESRRDN